jgi:glycosyltransferase involved in cell wall biosynthesis
MRILAVTNMYPGPTHPTLGTFVEQQIKGLRQAGHEVEVLFLDRLDEGVGVYRQAGERTRQQVRICQPDLVHVMYGGVLADRITRAVQDRPLAVSFCGSDLLGELLSGVVRKLISSLGVYASWRAAKRATGIIVKSRNLQDALPKSIDRARIAIIPNGVDLKRFSPADPRECRRKLGWPDHVMHVLFPANQGDPRKRPELARAAIELLNRRGLCAQLNVLKGVPHGDVPTWLNASDAVLLTSLHEGSPNVVKEALACNVPVVSVDVGDVVERLQGIEGCHVALPEAEDLAAKLRIVRQGAPRLQDGRERMRDLSLERVADRLGQFYESVLTRWHGAAKEVCIP